MQTNIDLIRKDKRWNDHKFIKKVFLKRIVNILVSEIDVFKYTNSIELTLLLTNNKDITHLNKEFLGKDRPTNVLSFPDKDLDYKNLSNKDFIGDVILGDIAFSIEVLEKESLEQDIMFQNHFTHLFLHAILHLIGYDHDLEEDFEIMKNLEIKLLNKLGIDKPPIYAKET